MITNQLFLISCGCKMITNQLFLISCDRKMITNQLFLISCDRKTVVVFYLCVDSSLVEPNTVLHARPKNRFYGLEDHNCD
jgi:hypothetical protein